MDSPKSLIFEPFSSKTFIFQAKMPKKDAHCTRRRAFRQTQAKSGEIEGLKEERGMTPAKS